MQLRSVADAARAVGMPLAVTRLTKEIMKQMQKQGRKQDDHSVVPEYFTYPDDGRKEGE